MHGKKFSKKNFRCKKYNSIAIETAHNYSAFKDTVRQIRKVFLYNGGIKSNILVEHWMILYSN